MKSFDPLQQPDTVFSIAHALLDSCPFGRSDKDGGFWVASGREQVLRVLQDRDTFHVGGETKAVRIPPDPEGFNRPLMPPQDVNPPLHRAFRAILNPHLAPAPLHAHEHDVRRTIGGLIDAFVPDGRCDVATSLAKVFPARVTFTDVFGIDDLEETEMVRRWVERIIYGRFREDPEVLGQLQRSWNEWTLDLIAQRRRHRRDDVLDALIFGSVEGGRPVAEMEVVGAIQVLILGGFMTTSDAACNLIVALIEHPTLQERLASDRSLIPKLIEEVLRLEPPVGARVRRCTATTKIDGHTVHPGDRVLVHLVAANRDPDEFVHPDDLDLGRPSNRHLAFGAGIHRCVGSNLARMTLQIALEELLERVRDISFAPGQRETRLGLSGATWRLVDSLPIEFRARRLR